MVALYVRYIKKGTVTNINRVASKWRDEVIEVITADGYIVEDDGTIRQVEA